MIRTARGLKWNGGTATTYFDLLSLLIDRVFYYRANTIFVDIIFAFGLIWTGMRLWREESGSTHRDLRHRRPRKSFVHYEIQHQLPEM
jgi:hypothetical protein